jgi:hypothetical protein
MTVAVPKLFEMFCYVSLQSGPMPIWTYEIFFAYAIVVLLTPPSSAPCFAVFCFWLVSQQSLAKINEVTGQKNRAKHFAQLAKQVCV